MADRKDRPPDPVREHPLSGDFYRFQRTMLASLIDAKLSGATAEELATLKQLTASRATALIAKINAL
jgi:hypothetical protein